MNNKTISAIAMGEKNAKIARGQRGKCERESWKMLGQKGMKRKMQNGCKSRKIRGKKST